MLKALVFTTLIFILMFPIIPKAQDLLNGPECVTFDTLYNRYLVSNYTDGKIVAIDTHGVQTVFATGLGHAYGNHIKDSVLYVSTGHSIVGLHLSDGSQIFYVAIASSNQMDGVTTDTSGFLYVVDNNFANFSLEKIWKVDLSDGSYSTFLSASTSNLAPGMQAIIFDSTDNRILLAGYSGNAPIQAISLPDGTVTDLVTTPTGWMDGITRDGAGNTYITDYQAGDIYMYDSNFTDPPELISSGHDGPSNIGYNIRDNILAIPNFDGDRVDYVDMKVRFIADTTVGDVPFDVSFDGKSVLPVDSWNWDFGDGEYSDQQFPLHTYQNGGMYNVTLEIESGGQVYTETKMEYVIALADSLRGGDVQCNPGDNIEVLIYGRNTTPVDYLNIPLEYAGSLGIVYDSFSTAGCRSEFLDTARTILYDPSARHITFRVYNETGSTAPALDAGSGPVLKVYFTVSASASPGQTAEIVLDGYGSQLPRFTSTIIGYTYPTPSPGVVSLLSLCGDINDDGNINILDITYMINYLYKDGPEPPSSEAADVDNSGTLNILDVTYLVNYLYKSGPDPFCG